MKTFKSIINGVLMGVMISSPMIQAQEVNTSLTSTSSSALIQADSNAALTALLLYMNELSYIYKIDYPWIEKKSNVSELDILKNIESGLKQRFSEESNGYVHPGWINSQAITFERREVCIDYGSIVTKNNKQKYLNQNSVSNSASSVISNADSNTLVGNVNYEKSGLLSMEKINLAAAINETKVVTKANTKFNQTTGYSVVEVTEHEKMTFCKKSRIEFRGSLNAEKILGAESTAPYVKYYLITRALKVMNQEFKNIYNNYLVNLNIILNTSVITDQTILKMKTGKVNLEAGDLVEYFSSTLISLAGAYKRLTDIIEISSKVNNEYFVALTKNSQRALEQMNQSLMKVFLTLEPYGRMENVQEETNWGEVKLISKSENVKEISVGIYQNDKLNSITLYSEKELNLLFKEIGNFYFKFQKVNPISNSFKALYYSNKEKELSEKQNQIENKGRVDREGKKIQIGSQVMLLTYDQMCTILDINRDSEISLVSCNYGRYDSYWAKNVALKLVRY